MKDIKDVVDYIRRIMEKEYLCHIQFVRIIALDLCKKYGGNKTIVELASLLHDIGKSVGDPHEITGAKLSRKLLKEWGFDDDIVNKVSRCILRHNLRTELPETLDEKIVATADAASKIKYMLAFSLLSKKETVKEKAHWIMKHMKKAYKNILFDDFKKEIKLVYDKDTLILGKILKTT